jgi:membrane fusion protein (multidrug efflux system)
MSLKKLYPLSFPLILVIAVACGGKNTGPMQFPPVQVVTQQVQEQPAFYFDEYPAVVRALQEVELRAQVSGYITAIHFKEGEKVRKGQALYSIDQQQSEAAYRQAQANLSAQEANLERAKRDVERYRQLDKQDAIAKQQVDYAEATYAAAQQQVEASKASVRAFQTNVRYSTIVAPFDGTIGISQVRLGASITPGQTLLNTISSDDPVAVDITVSQSEIYPFTQMLKAKTSKADSTFRLAFNGQVYPEFGKISIIDRAVDAQTGTIRMRVVFPNPDHTLRAGMTGTLRIQSPVQSSVVIPHKAVNEQLGEFFVYLADSAKATQRKVVLGKTIGKNIIVKSGLQVGDSIITEGIQNLREGSPIVVTKPAAPETAKK